MSSSTFKLVLINELKYYWPCDWPYGVPTKKKVGTFLACSVSQKASTWNKAQRVTTLMPENAPAETPRQMFMYFGSVLNISNTEYHLLLLLMLNDQWCVHLNFLSCLFFFLFNSEKVFLFAHYFSGTRWIFCPLLSTGEPRSLSPFYPSASLNCAWDVKAFYPFQPHVDYLFLPLSLSIGFFFF